MLVLVGKCCCELSLPVCTALIVKESFACMLASSGVAATSLGQSLCIGVRVVFGCCGQCHTLACLSSMHLNSLML